MAFYLSAGDGGKGVSVRGGGGRRGGGGVWFGGEFAAQPLGDAAVLRPVGAAHLFPGGAVVRGKVEHGACAAEAEVVVGSPDF